jgi:hypothetical protein
VTCGPSSPHSRSQRGAARAAPRLPGVTITIADADRHVDTR